jgi:hypothetical protein
MLVQQRLSVPPSLWSGGSINTSGRQTQRSVVDSGASHLFET